MLILALDTALTVCSVAVYDTDRDETLSAMSTPMDKGHAEALMPMVASCLEQAGVKVADCGLIATTIGPGSFTGLRVGISAARGLALAIDQDCLGIDTLAALAAPLRQNSALAVASCIDARHGHIFFALYLGGMVMVEPVLLSQDEAARIAAAQPCQLIGSGAKAVATAWPEGAEPPLLIDDRAAPDILWVARLAARTLPQEAPARPLYLRAPDAKPSTHLALARQ